MILGRLRHASAGIVAVWIGGVCFAIHGAIAFLYTALPFRKYTAAAEMFLRGEPAPERWMDFSPLYLRIVLTLHSLGLNAEALLPWLQTCLASITVAIVFLLFDRRLGRGWALVGAAVLIFDRQLLVYERILEPETLFLCLVFLFLWLIDGPNGEPARPLVAGAVGALGLAVRPTFLPLCLLALLLWGAQRRQPFRAWLKPAALFVAPLILTTGLLALRAERATGSFRAPTMNPGTVFFEGNQPMSLGTSAVYPPLVGALGQTFDGAPDPAHDYYRSVARQGTDEPMTTSQVNNFWMQKAFAFWLDHPRPAMARLSTKLKYTFHGFRWHDFPAAWVYDRSLPVPGVPFALLSALAFPGLLLEIRRRRDSLMFYALLVSQVTVMLTFYVSPRQRLILIPLLVYFSLVTLDSIRRQRLIWPGLLAILLLPAFVLPDHAMLDETYQRKQLEQSRHKLDQIKARLAGGEPMAAMVDEFADALADAPWWLDELQPSFVPRDSSSLALLVASKAEPRKLSAFDRGVLSMQAGDLAKARHLLLESIERGEQFYRQGRSPTSPELYLARIDTIEGRPAEAVARLRAALKQAPGDAYLLAELFAADRQPEHFALLQRYYGLQNAHFLVGRASMAQGRHDSAIEHLRETVRAFPRLREARLFLAAALKRSGHLDDGLEQALVADSIQPEPVLFADDIAELYRTEARDATGSRDVLRAAHGLFHYGKLSEALQVLDRPWSEDDAPVAAQLRIGLQQALAASQTTELDDQPR